MKEELVKLIAECQRQLDILDTNSYWGQEKFNIEVERARWKWYGMKTAYERALKLI